MSNNNRLTHINTKYRYKDLSKKKWRINPSYYDKNSNKIVAGNLNCLLNQYSPMIKDIFDRNMKSDGYIQICLAFRFVFF